VLDRYGSASSVEAQIPVRLDPVTLNCDCYFPAAPRGNRITTACAAGLAHTFANSILRNH